MPLILFARRFNQFVLQILTGRVLVFSSSDLMFPTSDCSPITCLFLFIIIFFTYNFRLFSCKSGNNLKWPSYPFSAKLLFKYTNSRNNHLSYFPNWPFWCFLVAGVNSGSAFGFHYGFRFPFLAFNTCSRNFLEALQGYFRKQVFFPLIIIYIYIYNLYLFRVKKKFKIKN